MANLTGSASYVNVLRQLEPTDPGHPSTWNPNYQALINNDVYLKALVERLIKDHSHDGTVSGGSKIPLANINVPIGESGILTGKDMTNHINERNPHGTRASDVGAETPAGAQTKADMAEKNARDYADSKIVSGPVVDISGKVDKVAGKGLSTEDYTTADKNKLSSIALNANNYVHPGTHPASMIEESPTKRFSSDVEKASWNARETTAGAQTKANTAELNAKRYADQSLKEEIAKHREDSMPHQFKEGQKTYKYGLKTNTAKDGLVFVYEEVL